MASVLRSEIAGSKDTYIFYIVVDIDKIALGRLCAYLHPSAMFESVSNYPCQHHILFISFTFANLIIKKRFIKVLICDFPTLSEDAHLFKCLTLYSLFCEFLAISFAYCDM